MEVDAVFTQRLITLFYRTAFDDLDMGGSAKNPILLDNEEDKENSFPKLPVSETQPRSPVLLTGHPFGTKTENVPDYIYGKLFQ